MAEETEDRSSEGESKDRVSRRGFLKTAVAGAAAVGVSVTAPRVLSGEIPLSSPSGGTAPAGNEPIVAYVGDARSGEIVLMAGERKIRVRDFGIVSQLVRALSGW